MSRCRAFNETWKHRCIKNARHRGYHKIEMPHAGRMRETYKATHVVLWK